MFAAFACATYPIHADFRTVAGPESGLNKMHVELNFFSNVPCVACVFNSQKGPGHDLQHRICPQMQSSFMFIDEPGTCLRLSHSQANLAVFFNCTLECTGHSLKAAEPVELHRSLRSSHTQPRKERGCRLGNACRWGLTDKLQLWSLEGMADWVLKNCCLRLLEIDLVYL